MSDIEHEDIVKVVNDLSVFNRQTGETEVLAKAGSELKVVGVSDIAVGEEHYVSLYIKDFGTVITPSSNVELKEKAS